MEDVDARARYQSTSASELEPDAAAGARGAERTALARELHDTVIQPLTSLVLSFTCFERQPPVNADHMTGHVGVWKELAQEALDSLRTALAGLQPFVDVGRDLTEALHRLLVSQLGSRGLRLVIESHNWPLDLPLEWTRHLYLAVREAVTNAEKHARASVVNVRLCALADGLMITVVDNGVGLGLDDLAAWRFAPPGCGNGLGGIRERLSLLGGRLVIASAPDGGARLEMWLPNPMLAADRAHWGAAASRRLEVE
jgi:NarL family two-component system sensor histidine kinase LiaS